MPDSGPARTHRPSEVSLVDLARVLRRWRSMVLLLAFGLPFLTAVVMLFTPNKYTSVGTLLVETPEGGLGSDFLGQIRSITGFAPQVPPTEMYLAILRSERVGLAVADSLDLVTHYEIEADTPEERMERLLKKLHKRVTFDSPDLITINIAATDRNPQMAADMVNGYLNQLEVANQTLALSRARRTRQLVSEALEQTETELDSTFKVMQRFQERYGVFSIEKQTEGTLDLIGTLQAELLSQQTQRDALQGFTSQGSGQLRKIDLKIKAVKAQIQHLIGELETTALVKQPDGLEKKPAAGRAKDPYFLPLRELPKLAGEYARIAMDLKVQEAKYSVLATQLEQTKVEESQSIPSFEILDRGRRPHRKSSPRRTLFVLAALLGGTLAGVLLAVVLDDLERRVDAETRRELIGVLPAFMTRPIKALKPSPRAGRD